MRDLHRAGYTLAVIDSGLGMPASDITAANRRLAGAESFTIAPSKYLGHYVAGNLAARHDIRVTLDNSPGNGITATLDLPPTLLTTDTPTATGDEPHAARDIWPPAPSTAPAPPAQPQPRPTHSPGPGPQRDRAASNGGPRSTTPPAPPPRPDAERPPWLGGPVPGAPAPTGPALPVNGSIASGPPVDRRTPSGLAKRTPRVVDTGEVPAIGSRPDDNLLASLRRVTRPGQGATGVPAAPQIPPGAPRTPPGTPQSPPGGPPASPPPRRPQGAPLGGLAAGLGGLTPFDPRTARTDHGPSGPAGPAPTPGDRGPARPGGTGGQGGHGGQGGPPPVPGQTARGLTRRVRGAQLPNADPLALRRTGAPPPAPAGPPPPVAPTQPARTPEQQQSADAVYSFLTDFTAGVRRGLDESHRRPRA